MQSRIESTVTHILEKPSPVLRDVTTNEDAMLSTIEIIRIVYHQPAISFLDEPPHNLSASADVN